MMKTRHGHCSACDERGPVFPYHNNFYCEDCYEELSRGKIKNYNMHFCGNGHDSHGKDEDEPFGIYDYARCKVDQQ